MALDFNPHYQNGGRRSVANSTLILEVANYRAIFLVALDSLEVSVMLVATPVNVEVQGTAKFSH